MLPEVRMPRVLDAISSHRAGRLSCVEAGELLGFSERHFRRLRYAMRIAGRMGCPTKPLHDTGNSGYNE